MRSSDPTFALALALATAVASGLAGCVATDEPDPAGPPRRGRSAAIRDVAASQGLHNAVVLAGIAQVESGLAHCWSEATWACQGPMSAFCGGPVIAGAADGPCAARQGGLGMFQFDGGTYEQTLARDGEAILELDGSIAHAVDFVIAIAIRHVPGVATRDDALAWINGIAIDPGDPRFAAWNDLLACRYNGACGSAAQAAKYRDATLAAYDELGAEFWAVAAVAAARAR
jgi:hypothetical protein